MANFATARGVRNVEPSLWKPGAVDDLVPQESRDDLEYIEYNRDIKGPPDYAFQIQNMSSLIQQETKFLGKKFLLPNSREVAQIKCSVTFSNVRLSLALLSPSPSESCMLKPLILVAVIKRGQPADDIVLTCELKEEHYSKRFDAFCSFNYAEKMRNPEDSLVIHLYAKNEWEEIIPAEVFRWKVDFSNMDITDELGLTPFFYADSQGFRVQIRLFLRGEQVVAKFRFTNWKNEISMCTTDFSVKLILINPGDQRLNIVHSFSFREWFKLEEWNKIKFRNEISTISEIVSVKQVLPFLLNNKLMVKVKLCYYEK